MDGNNWIAFRRPRRIVWHRVPWRPPQEADVKLPPIYVETTIRTNVDELWERTQDPALHQRWDLRFTTIEFLPKRDEDDPQRFLYETRIRFGLRIAGEGESVGS